jgi:CubicO group peptidase (beta-lactamase class C family)
METTFGGHTDPAFDAVREAFAYNFDKGRETGAALCIHHNGRPVVDIHGGAFDRKGSAPYDADTLQLVFSTTKGATAVCANLLAQRGELDLSAPVADYWPEFAQAGKADIPVLYLLTHQAGLPAVDRSLTAEEVQAWEPICSALAEQTPFWEPGKAHGYHALTYGWLVGEVVRRVSGRSIGTYFAEEIAGPLGLEFWIGLPEEYESRVASVFGGAVIPEGIAQSGGAPVDDASTLMARALNAAGAFTERGWMNTRPWHAAEVPAANAITNATSLSRLYAALIGTVEGGPAEPLLNAAQVDQARTVRTAGPDQCFLTLGFSMEQKIGQGFWVSSPFSPFGAEGAFGHAGAGGSYGFADPENGLAVGYVMNQMSAGVVGDPRSRRIIKAVYSSIGVEPKYF